MPMSSHKPAHDKVRSCVIEFTPVGVAHSQLTTAGAPPFQSVFSQEEGEIEIFPAAIDVIAPAAGSPAVGACAAAGAQT